MTPAKKPRVCALDDCDNPIETNASYRQIYCSPKHKNLAAWRRRYATPEIRQTDSEIRNAKQRQERLARRGGEATGQPVACQWPACGQAVPPERLARGAKYCGSACREKAKRHREAPRDRGEYFRLRQAERRELRRLKRHRRELAASISIANRIVAAANDTTRSEFSQLQDLIVENEHLKTKLQDALEDGETLAKLANGFAEIGAYPLTPYLKALIRRYLQPQSEAIEAELVA